MPRFHRFACIIRRSLRVALLLRVFFDRCGPLKCFSFGMRNRRPGNEPDVILSASMRAAGLPVAQCAAASVFVPPTVSHRVKLSAGSSGGVGVKGGPASRRRSGRPAGSSRLGPPLQQWRWRAHFPDAFFASFSLVASLFLFRALRVYACARTGARSVRRCAVTGNRSLISSQPRQDAAAITVVLFGFLSVLADFSETSRVQAEPADS